MQVAICVKDTGAFKQGEIYECTGIQVQKDTNLPFILIKNGLFCRMSLPPDSSFCFIFDPTGKVVEEIKERLVKNLIF